MESMPVFVRIQDPSEIHIYIEELRENLDEIRSTLDTFKSLSQEELQKFSLKRFQRDVLQIVTS